MISTMLSILFVFNPIRYRKPVDDEVRQCWICDQLFHSYLDNPLLVCIDCKDAINENGYKNHVMYLSKIKKKNLKRFNGIDNYPFL